MNRRTYLNILPKITLFFSVLFVCFYNNGFSQVTNTTCATASVIAINACSTSTPLPASGVTGSAQFCVSGATVRADLWYQFTTLSSPATIPTTITAVTSTGQLPTSKDLAFEVYLGPSCPGSLLYCVNSGLSTTEQTVVALPANTTYFVRIVNVGTSGALPMTTQVCIYEPPLNDVVTGATPLAIGTGTCNYSAYTFTTGTASSGSGNDCWSTPSCANYGGTSTDVWFSVSVPASGNFFLQTKGAIASQNYGMAVYSSSVCASAVELGCSNANPVGNPGGAASQMEMPSLYVSGATPFTTVYVRVWNENTKAINTFSICANDMGPCGNLLTNDYCSNPTAINTSGATGASVASNNTGMAYTNDVPGNLSLASSYGCLFPTLNAWYSFIATTANATSGLNIPFSTGAAPCTSVSATVFSVTTITNGCCRDFTKINTNTCGPNTTGSGANGTFTLNIPAASLTAGATYYLMVNYASGGAPCSYSVTGWSASGILPVEYLSFTGNNEGSYNLVEWSYALEKNVSNYTLEHSNNAVTFSPVATLAAKGNNAVNVKYNVRDENPYPDVTYYRIKEKDLVGTEKYSNIISVSLRSLYDNIYNIHPNPTSNDLNFEYYSKSFNELYVEVISYGGSVVLKLDQAVTEGKNKITIPMSELDNGVYILKVVSGKSGKTTHHKIIKN